MAVALAVANLEDLRQSVIRRLLWKQSHTARHTNFRRACLGPPATMDKHLNRKDNYHQHFNNPHAHKDKNTQNKSVLTLYKKACTYSNTGYTKQYSHSVRFW